MSKPASILFTALVVLSSMLSCQDHRGPADGDTTPHIAKIFSDLPQNQRSKLRLLHIIVGTTTYFDPQKEIENDPLNGVSKIYQQFISNHQVPHDPNFNHLSFENHFLKLTSEDSTYFSINRDLFDYTKNEGIAFGNETIGDRQGKAIFDKILEEKRKRASSIVVFWVPFTYQTIGAYATGIGRHRIVISYTHRYKGTYYSPYLNTLAHEIGHTLGMDHDPVCSVNASYLMVGQGTKYVAPLTYFKSVIDFPQFIQSKDYEQSCTVINNPTLGKSTTNNGISIQAQGYLYPNSLPFPFLLPPDTKGDVIHLRGEITSGEKTFFPALENHLIEQYNISVAPDKVTKFEGQVPRNGRLHATVSSCQTIIQ